MFCQLLEEAEQRGGAGPKFQYYVQPSILSSVLFWMPSLLSFVGLFLNC